MVSVGLEEYIDVAAYVWICFSFLRQNLVHTSLGTLSSQSSCLSILCAGITGLSHYAWLGFGFESHL